MKRALAEHLNLVLHSSKLLTALGIFLLICGAAFTLLSSPNSATGPNRSFEFFPGSATRVGPDGT